jgi:hypothetical protein
LDNSVSRGNPLALHAIAQLRATASRCPGQAYASNFRPSARSNNMDLSAGRNRGRPFTYKTFSNSFKKPANAYWSPCICTVHMKSEQGLPVKKPMSTPNYSASPTRHSLVRQQISATA